MELDLTRTQTLLAAYEATPPVTSFLKDRYFPTNNMTDIFNTDDVLVDFKDNGRKVAPFVLPTVGGVPTGRAAYTTDRFTPPLIAPKRTLSVDELKKRGFGEAIFSGVAPADRKVLITFDIMPELPGYGDPYDLDGKHYIVGSCSNDMGIITLELIGNER